ncbi:IS3 family transposase [Desemzia sp. FAM 23991]|uniref:IS3 family transposase n=1 Tax=unclassified Desemzia TaxID=2685243 RepID=UPI003884054C
MEHSTLFIPLFTLLKISSANTNINLETWKYIKWYNLARSKAKLPGLSSVKFQTQISPSIT